jgi:hypothetical protein
MIALIQILVMTLGLDLVVEVGFHQVVVLLAVGKAIEISWKLSNNSKIFCFFLTSVI